MHEGQNHIIRKETVRIKAQVANPMLLQSRIQSILNSDATAGLGAMFDTLSLPDEWLVVDKLDIEIENIQEDKLEEKFTGILLQKVQEQLQQQLAEARNIVERDPSLLNISSGERTLRAFLFFLEYGVLPWWYTVSTPHAFEEAVLQELHSYQSLPGLPAYVLKYTRSIQDVVSRYSGALRLVSQFNTKLVEAAIAFLLHANAAVLITEAIAAYTEFIALITSATSRQTAASAIALRIRASFIQRIVLPGAGLPISLAEWLRAAIDVLRKERSPITLQTIRANSILRKYIPLLQNWETEDTQPTERDIAVDLISSDSKTVQERGIDNSEEGGRPQQKPDGKIINDSNHDSKYSEAEKIWEEGIAVENAGLVLIAPFLPTFFSHCNLLKEDVITDPHRAIGLLHYLVFGNLDYKEYDALLSKILCGAEEALPIELIKDLSDDERNQAEDLLTAVISHWAALKNTSSDGLREGFLQRKGILRFNEGDWILQVEPNTIDILLESIPWTIGLIKLPWMKHYLHTSWN
ncbi:MAG TPA: contractile injection system tape measure protein [Ohtaekwangia sp.]|uniref:contractile injection system tape measure protein n=1 Tax=Ohtaekwangia sp. TaxID=2066019 RepID=UPI002F950E93